MILAAKCRGWDGWMASPTQWTWVWVNSGSWWKTGRPGLLQSVGSQRVGHDWATELNWHVEQVNWSCALSFLQSNCWMLKAFTPRFFLPRVPYGALCMPILSGRNRGGLGWEGTWGFGNELLWDCILHVLLAMAELSFQLAPVSTSLTMWHFTFLKGEATPGHLSWWPNL